MIRKMSKAEKEARHLPLEEDHWIDTSYYAYSSGRKVNLENRTNSRDHCGPKLQYFLASQLTNSLGVLQNGEHRPLTNCIGQGPSHYQNHRQRRNPKSPAFGQIEELLPQYSLSGYGREKVRAEYGAKRISQKLEARILEYLKNEVAVYDQYLTGDVWGYVVKKDGEEIESCWGLFGREYCEAEAESVIEHLKNI